MNTFFARLWLLLVARACVNWIWASCRVTIPLSLFVSTVGKLRDNCALLNLWQALISLYSLWLKITRTHYKDEHNENCKKHCQFNVHFISTSFIFYDQLIMASQIDYHKLSILAPLPLLIIRNHLLICFVWLNWQPVIISAWSIAFPTLVNHQ